MRCAVRSLIYADALHESVPVQLHWWDAFRPPATPSPFLVESLANFEQSFDQMTQVVRELEQLHLPRGGGSEIRGLLLRQGIKEEDMDKSMSKILENFVVYFNHVLSQYSKVSHP